MNRYLRALMAAVLLCWAIGPVTLGAANEKSFEIRQPTVLAFFPPVTEKDLDDDPDTNTALSDFQFYVAQVRSPLLKVRVDLEEVYAHSFLIRLGDKTILVRPRNGGIAYYFIAPGKKPHVEENGVLTSGDILRVAHKYFGIPPAKSSSTRHLPLLTAF